ncbi:MAG: helix-turn-helix transcriptional regulator [Eubacterium sp.]|nr:helix-turn-helix transcriptional regulator [Clostridiales bacterium]MDY3773809.1 helix-turn-helix transcriptional regulator [Eubacterium sp.]
MEDITISLASQVHYKYDGLFESNSPNWIHMTRILEEYELIVVTEGILHIADSEKNYTIKKDEYLIMKPGYQSGSAPSLCSFYWLHFECPMTGFENEPFFSLPCQGSITSMPRISATFSQLNDVNFTYRDERTNNIYAMNILLEIYNQCQENKWMPHSFKDYLLKNVKNYVKWNQAYHLTVKDLADYFGYHPKYLSSLFHKETGMTLKQYLVKETMNCAKEELYNTNRSIQAIALSLGFCDSHAFSHAFKCHTGMTPTEYRNSHHPIIRNSD